DWSFLVAGVRHTQRNSISSSLSNNMENMERKDLYSFLCIAVAADYIRSNRNIGYCDCDRCGSRVLSWIMVFHQWYIFRCAKYSFYMLIGSHWQLPY
ncbi:hypothetical protein, partial [uncultured Duncaniella sp.]|uniref:hypothetical protein n=1 Tax=uncultured Duncaniella sp. TaxID=2768039 RepID=UPI00272AA58F